MKKEFEVLKEFLNMSVFSADEVFEKFQTDKDGKMYQVYGQKFYFKPGTRKDRILFVAHADTVWDKRYKNFGSVDEKYWDIYEEEGYKKSKVIETPTKFISGNENHGLGADDRAGAAIAWLMKDTGNSILITDCEEIGALSARYLMQDPHFKKIIDSHRYMVQFDLNGKNQFKCYYSGNEDFKALMEFKTKGNMLPNFSFTDITILGKNICGANIATGYKFEHTPYEYLNKKDWFKAYKIANKLAKDKHQQFYVDPEFGRKYMKQEDKIKIYNIKNDFEKSKNINNIKKYNNIKDDKENEIEKL